MKEIKEMGNYEIAKGLPDLTKTTGKILSIKEGKVIDFINNPEKWKGNTDGGAVNITIKSNETGRIFDQLLTLPEGNTISDRSNLAKFIAMNDRTPKVGMEVKLIVKDGFEKLFL